MRGPSFLKDAPVLFSIALALLVLLLTAYPIVAFYLTAYLPKPKGFGEGSWVEYYGEIVVTDGRLLQLLYRLNVSLSGGRYAVSLTLYNATGAELEGPLAFPPGAMADLDVSGLPILCSSSSEFRSGGESALLKVIIVDRRDGGEVVRADGYVLRISGTGDGFTYAGFLAYYPDAVLGYARVYEAEVVINGTPCPRFECPAAYLRAGDVMLLGSLALRYSHVGQGPAAKPLLLGLLLDDFGDSCPLLGELAELVEGGGAAIAGEYLFLKSLSFIPDDQAWLDALAALIVVGRVRGWL